MIVCSFFKNIVDSWKHDIKAFKLFRFGIETGGFPLLTF